ncbi:MAG: molybdenum cofactor guanylyltransferase MobA [Halioglobus sp.]
MTSKTHVTGLILAGGAGRRVGNRDKGLIPWQGKPLVAHVSARLRPQVDELLISCNRNARFYTQFATLTVADNLPHYQGPLAGLEAASAHIKTEFVVVVGCDTPCLPRDLVSRLLSPLADPTAARREIAYAHDGRRAHYLCAALRRECLSSLPLFLATGKRAVHEWYGSRAAIKVDFSGQESCFRNINELT